MHTSRNISERFKPGPGVAELQLQGKIKPCTVQLQGPVSSLFPVLAASRMVPQSLFPSFWVLIILLPGCRQSNEGLILSLCGQTLQWFRPAVAPAYIPCSVPPRAPHPCSCLGAGGLLLLPAHVRPNHHSSQRLPSLAFGIKSPFLGPPSDGTGHRCHHDQGLTTISPTGI